MRVFVAVGATWALLMALLVRSRRRAEDRRAANGPNAGPPAT
jgi:hypothetical protein